MTDRSRLAFLEIGTSDFDVLCGGLGLSVEPLKLYTDRLAVDARVVRLNLAVSDADGWDQMYYVDPVDIRTHDLPDWFRGCSALGRPHPTVTVLLKTRGLEHLIRRTLVERVSFSTLVRRQGVRSVELLKIDTEGHDCTILRSLREAIASDLLEPPQRIQFESNVLSDPEEVERELSAFVALGYRVVSRGDDTTLEYASRETKSARLKVLFFMEEAWAFGRVHADLVRALHPFVQADVLDWRKVYSRELMQELAVSYDLLVTIPTEARILTDDYGVPASRIAVVAHGECDLRKTAADRWPSFAAFGVVSEGLRETARRLGIQRLPCVVPVGVDVERFSAPPPTRLRAIGYASTLERIEEGRDIKRGHLAGRIARELGVEFYPAPIGTHLLAMPSYYRSVDAIVVTSLSESVALPALEGAAARRIVLGTRVGVLPELASRGGALLLPSDEEDLVAEAVRVLRRFQADPSALQVQGDRAHDAAKDHGWDVCAPLWVDMLRGACI